MLYVFREMGETGSSLTFSHLISVRFARRAFKPSNEFVTCFSRILNLQIFFTKGPDHLGPVLGILSDFWVPYEIKSCNFRTLFVFGFPETSFRQLLLSSFQRGLLEKFENTRNLPKLPLPGTYYASFLEGCKGSLSGMMAILRKLQTCWKKRKKKISWKKM